VTGRRRAAISRCGDRAVPNQSIVKHGATLRRFGPSTMGNWDTRSLTRLPRLTCANGSNAHGLENRAEGLLPGFQSRSRARRKPGGFLSSRTDLAGPPNPPIGARRGPGEARSVRTFRPSALGVLTPTMGGPTFWSFMLHGRPRSSSGCTSADGRCRPPPEKFTIVAAAKKERGNMVRLTDEQPPLYMRADGNHFS